MLKPAVCCGELWFLAVQQGLWHTRFRGTCTKPSSSSSGGCLAHGVQFCWIVMNFYESFIKHSFTSAFKACCLWFLDALHCLSCRAWQGNCPVSASHCFCAHADLRIHFKKLKICRACCSAEAFQSTKACSSQTDSHPSLTQCEVQTPNPGAMCYGVL